MSRHTPDELLECIHLVEGQLDEIEHRMNLLEGVSDQEWRTAKDQVDAALTQAERSVRHIRRSVKALTS